ncbi:3-isopropylmalate dehydrogenase [Varunaivibrio sulfuroxidans]|uniref:3-isopropylmalate dehydrogenase n=1 Tax=Varunaivibrio sulfuroxidans TaxID=1773489 RepID=A0A4R3JD54_9PROT|nr:3-isopropylmalate dehydrogenase [Varunaivibrio sulfuroxidans]TCS63617.1 3-isopropylmalate dehydrogenase [Varunaivibrio sulfuroxidans]WES30241.1 3-isopropylmalate dehydrogenase [Varunaivibrio sulfuroxidans]
MSANMKLLMLAGDGIGPEVMGEVKRVISWMDKRRHVAFDLDEDLVGGACYDAHGVAVTDATMDKAMSVDAVLLGAVGGPKWDDVARAHRPEAGLLRLRKDMDLFANLRPAVVFDALIDASTLKPEVVRGLDIMIVRELTAGVYFGQPRGTDVRDGVRYGFDTQIYSEPEIDRVARVAFDLAKKRGNKVTSVEKANVMESGVFWREVVSNVHREAYGDVALNHMYADNCAMQLVRWPGQFDVIVTDNLFGDILSDCAAMLTGSLGMLPSASLGEADASGFRRAMYEPVHGSAPDIAGQNKANPLATVLSFSMMLRYSFDMGADADLIDAAVKNVLAAGLRTADIMSDGATLVSTEGMGRALIGELDKMAA